MTQTANDATERYNAQMQQLTVDNRGLMQQIIERKQALVGRHGEMQKQKSRNAALEQQVAQALQQRKVLDAENAQLQDELSRIKEQMWVLKTQHGEKVNSARIAVERTAAMLGLEKEECEETTKRLEAQISDLKSQVDALEDRTRKEVAFVRRTIDEKLEQDRQTQQRSEEQTNQFKAEIESCAKQAQLIQLEIEKTRNQQAAMERQLNSLIGKKQSGKNELQSREQIDSLKNLTPEQERLIKTQIWTKSTVDELRELLTQENDSMKKQMLDCDVEIQALQSALKKRQALEADLVAVLDNLTLDTEQQQRVNGRLEHDAKLGDEDVAIIAREGEELQVQLDALKRQGISAPLRHRIEDAAETSPDFYSSIVQSPSYALPKRLDAPYLDSAKDLAAATRQSVVNRHGGFTDPGQVIEELSASNIRLYSKLQKQQRVTSKIYAVKPPAILK